MSKKKKIVLFQAFLRKPTLSLVEHLKNFEYIHEKPLSQTNFYQALPKNFTKETQRKKNSLLNFFRGIFGLLNFRVKVDYNAELILSYSFLLITNKPYCINIKN